MGYNSNYYATKEELREVINKYKNLLKVDISNSREASAQVLEDALSSFVGYVEIGQEVPMKDKNGKDIIKRDGIYSLVLVAIDRFNRAQEYGYTIEETKDLLRSSGQILQSLVRGVSEPMVANDIEKAASHRNNSQFFKGDANFMMTFLTPINKRMYDVVKYCYDNNKMNITADELKAYEQNSPKKVVLGVEGAPLPEAEEYERY